MSRFESAESVFFSPLTAEWTIAGLLEWIGADDARCHDDRLAGLMDAIHRALQPDVPRAGGGVVTLVRSLAMRASAERGLGERTVRDLVGVREPETSASAEVGVLVSV